MVSALFPLDVKAATARRRGKRLVGPIDLRLEGGGACALLGPNGAGKTTFLRLLHGLERLSGGQIDWACSKEAAQAAQSFVFQYPIMLRRSVIENLCYPMVQRGHSRKDALKEARNWVEAIGLNGLQDRQATTLSGGEQQKLALARALITKPELVLLDEPTAALDGTSKREVEDMLRKAMANGTSIIFASHDIGQARRLADHVIFLLGGQIHEQASAPDFFAAPKTPEARAFLSGDIVE